MGNSGLLQIDRERYKHNIFVKFERYLFFIIKNTKDYSHMRLISAIQYLDKDVERHIVDTYLTKDKFSEETMKDTILPYIGSLDDIFYKNGFTGELKDRIHIDRVDPERCVSPNLMLERRAGYYEWYRVRMRVKRPNHVLTRGILTSKGYTNESDKLARLQFMAKVLSKQVKEFVRVDEIEIPSVKIIFKTKYHGFDVKWKGMKIKFSRRPFTV